MKVFDIFSWVMSQRKKTEPRTMHFVYSAAPDYRALYRYELLRVIRKAMVSRFPSWRLIPYEEVAANSTATEEELHTALKVVSTLFAKPHIFRCKRKRGVKA